MSHKIGITACSNPMHPSFSVDLARLCQILRELGFDPVLSPCLYDNGSGFSGTGAERADAFMNLYCDPEITDIFDVSGGDMANEVLPYLDFLSSPPPASASGDTVISRRLSMLSRLRLE